MVRSKEKKTLCTDRHNYNTIRTLCRYYNSSKLLSTECHQIMTVLQILILNVFPLMDL